MNRTSFFNEILPTQFPLGKTESGADSLKVYDKKVNNKLKDINFIKKIAREKVRLNGAPIRYFPIDPDSNNSTNNASFGLDNTFDDHTNLTLGPPIDLMATWTPQEYQLDLSKWGVMMPAGSDQQLFIHVDDLTQKVGRKPLIGDIIETVNDTIRYKVADVFYGHANLWENIFCMVTLSKTTYDNYTSQLDQYDGTTYDDDSTPDIIEGYADTYSKLEEVLDIMDNNTETPDDDIIKIRNESNESLLQEKETTNSFEENVKKSIDTQIKSETTVTTEKTGATPIESGLDIMTMRL